jgi:hypothetical protein
MTADTIDTVELRRQLAEGTPSRSYLLAIMPVVLDRLAAAEARVAVLMEAARAVVDEYASHDVMCAICDPDWPGATPPECSCGFDAALTAWRALLDGGDA